MLMQVEVNLLGMKLGQQFNQAGEGAALAGAIKQKGGGNADLKPRAAEPSHTALLGPPPC